jgi:hypothetical protein
MTLHGNTRRALIAICFAVLGAVYAIAWLTPAVGLYHDDGVYLVTAKALAAGHGYTIESLPHAIPQTKYPPLFPALLALFLLVSQQTQWLKLLPLLCAAGWLAVTFRLLRKMGATANGALVLVFLTAISPTVVFLSTSLMSEPLFALLVAASLLMLLEDRPWTAGALAGLATLTRTAGAPLIVACILTLAIRRRFAGALRFSAAAMILAAPWFGWSLARVPRDPYYGAGNYASLNILTSLPANEKLTVFASNLLSLLASPAELLTGFTGLYAMLGTLLIFSWCLYVRRQLLPDLFVGLYCLMLLCWAWPPPRFIVPVLPLLLWMAWRVVTRARIQEAVAAAVLIIAGAGLWSDGTRIPGILSAGALSTGYVPADDWHEMQKLFSYIRANTLPTSVLVGNLDPVLYLNTGRRAIRGFAPDAFGLVYAERQQGITPDQVSGAILHEQADYVVLMPDRGFVEAPSFHSSVEALERGGRLQPVAIPGLSAEYRLLRVQ